MPQNFVEMCFVQISSISLLGFTGILELKGWLRTWP